MLLLTGATGLVGSALLPRLLDRDVAVRCLVRDPRRLGANRVRVQIALGDLRDPRSFRNAMRGVNTIVHLAAATRDQPGGSIEELSALATWRMVDAARRAGVERFVFFSALGASMHSVPRLFRAKAVAERAVLGSGLRSTVIAPSLIYAPGDRGLRLIERLALLPVVPVPGNGRAHCQPIWVDDVADCVVAVLRGDAVPPASHAAEPGGREAAEPGGREAADPAQHVRYELAGPETFSYDDFIRTVLHAAGRDRPLAHIPPALARRTLGALTRTIGEEISVTWDEAELLRVDSLSHNGPADARALGVEPQRMSLVLGLG